MKLLWLRKLIVCTCLDTEQQTKQAVERSQMPGIVIGAIYSMTDEQIAGLEEKDRLERLFKESS